MVVAVVLSQIAASTQRVIEGVVELDASVNTRVAGLERLVEDKVEKTVRDLHHAYGPPPTHATSRGRRLGTLVCRPSFHFVWAFHTKT